MEGEIESCMENKLFRWQWLSGGGGSGEFAFTRKASTDA